MHITTLVLLLQVMSAPFVFTLTEPIGNAILRMVSLGNEEMYQVVSAFAKVFFGNLYFALVAISTLYLVAFLYLWFRHGFRSFFVIEKVTALISLPYFGVIVHDLLVM